MQRTDFDKFRYVLEQSSLVSTTNTQGIITSISTAYCEYLGYTKQALIGKPMSCLLAAHPEVLSYTSFWPSVIQGKVWQGEMIEQNKQGKACRMAKTIIPIFNEAQEAEEVLHISVKIATPSDIASLPLPSPTEPHHLLQQQRFRALIENLDDTVFLLDERGSILYASLSCDKQFGYQADTLLDQPFSTLIHQNDVDSMQKLFSEVISTTQRVFRGTCRVVKGNQSFQWVEIKAQNLLEDAMVQAIVIHTRNVTNRNLAEEKILLALDDEKKLNEALAQSEQRIQQTLELMQETQELLSLLIEQSPIGVQIFNTEGYPISMNKTLEKLTGLTIADVKDYCILKDQQLEELQVLSRIRAAFAGEAVEIPDIQYSLKCKGKEKRKLWMRAFAYAIKDKCNDVKNVILIYEDIGEQKQAEEALRAAYKALEEAQEFAKLGSWHIDLRTERIEWSKQVFLSFGLSADASPPQDLIAFRQYIHPNDRSLLENTVRNAIALKKAYTLELRQLQPNNTYKWVLAKGKPLFDESGVVYAFSGINLDIHERKLYEEQLRNALEKELLLNTELAQREEQLRETNRNLSNSNEELRKINEELDRFVYSASHDLRAPIASVLGLIAVSKLSEDTEEIHKYLDLQERSIKKLDNFIQEILDYSRNARTKVLKEEIDLQTMVTSIFEQHTYMVNAHDVQKKIQISQPVPFYSDRNRLIIILNNLISNAIRYANMHQPQAIIKVKARITKKEATIEVVDNGQGIGEEHLDKIFEMFYRATEKQSGSGLGLYIVKETVEKLGGKIFIRSKLSEGTHVIFVIPNTH
ncbi:MAG: PAS domain S-box protein [Bacteroidota bacterium]